MAGDILTKYIGKFVVIEINALARPENMRDVGELYVGRVSEYDGSLVTLSPFVYERGNVNIHQTEVVDGLVRKLANINGNLEPQEPETLNRDLIGRMRAVRLRDHHFDEE